MRRAVRPRGIDRAAKDKAMRDVITGEYKDWTCDFCKRLQPGRDCPVVGYKRTLVCGSCHLRRQREGRETGSPLRASTVDFRDSRGDSDPGL